MLEKIKKASLHKYLLALFLALATFLRLYRINELLGFWYDQGRDALVIWDFIYKGKFFLIGPTTGIEGVLRGPWYYWLLTPFYRLGQGNPIYPTVFTILTTVFAIFVLYKVGCEFGGKNVGLLSAFLASFSVYIIGISRWLSIPPLMLLIGISVIWAVFKFLQKKVWALPLIGFLVGMSLQLGGATEYFYIPVLLIIFVWKRKLLPKFKTLLVSFGLFVLAFIPQGFFELRHPGALTGPLMDFLLHGKPSGLSLGTLVTSHISYFYSLIASKFWVNDNALFAPFFILFVGFLIIRWQEFKKDAKFIIVLIFSVAPFLGLLFFNGNSGNIYDYYFTGYFQIWFLLFSYVFIKMAGSKVGKIILGIFLLIFIYSNGVNYVKSYTISLNDPELIAFSNQLAAIDWIYKDSGGRDFNVDEYVPPVIPYAYQYLFEWLGTEKYKRLPLDKNISLLYTLYEVDPDHPERLQAWLDRQKGIGKVISEQRFGGIVVQERKRILGK
jgi:4-amino-4-deoxy-L-arabinose transferase-like glycosyltransferase